MGNLIKSCSGRNVCLDDLGIKIKNKSINDDYIITKNVLGEGLNGKILLIKNKNTNQNFAYKKLKENPKSRREIRLQVKASQKCDYILKIVDVYKQNKKYLDVVLEYAAGGDLFEKINLRANTGYLFKENEVKYIMKQIISGVKHMHELNIAHRDLKPENFLLSSNSIDPLSFKIKIADFGFAKEVTEGLRTPCYTETFVPPEILRQYENFKKYDLSCDIWTLGVILYMLLSFEMPFRPKRGLNLDNSPGMHKSILKAEFQFPKTMQNRSDKVKDLIEHMIVSIPKNRFTIQEIERSEWLATSDQDLEGEECNVEWENTIDEDLNQLENYLAENRIDYDSVILKPLNKCLNPLLKKHSRQ